MKTYRSFQTVPAVQYLGDPIDGITCDGTPQQRAVNGCDPTRAHLRHVHTEATGGLTVLKLNDWITPHPGGPFRVMPDGWFRSRFEVPAEVRVVADDPIPTTGVTADLDQTESEPSDSFTGAVADPIPTGAEMADSSAGEPPAVAGGKKKGK